MPDALSRQICDAITTDKLLTLHRSLCHPGVTRLTQTNLPYPIEFVKKGVSSCRVCSETKPRFLKYTGNLIKTSDPFERLSMDYKGPIPTTSNNKYLLTNIDE